MEYQELAPIAKLLNETVLSVLFVDYKILIIPLKIVGEDMDLGRVIQGQGV